MNARKYLLGGLAFASAALLLACGGGGGGGSAPAAPAATPTTYKVTYNGNGSTGGTVPVDSASYQLGATVTVLGNTGTLADTGHTFSGWNTAANGTGTSYAAGQSLTMGAANLTLYAQWSANTVLGFAFTVNQYDYTISQMTVGANGALTANTPATVATGVDPNSLAVDPSGKYLYAVALKGATSANYGNISQYTIGTDGTLTPMSPATIAPDYGTEDIVVHPSGKYAYAATFYYPLGGKQTASVAQYNIGSTGALTPMSTPAIAITGGTPQFLAMHPSGKFLYLADGSGVVEQFTIDQTTGALAAMTPATVPAFTPVGHTTFAITVHPSGKYAYVTDYYGGILEYTIDATSGALTQLAQTTVDGAVKMAAWITVDPSGKYAYVANAGTTTNAISQFTVGSDGSLTAMSPASVAATSATTNVQVDSTGTYLYATSGLGTGATNIVSQYVIGANGTLTPASPATAQVGSGPNAIVLVK